MRFIKENGPISAEYAEKVVWASDRIREADGPLHGWDLTAVLEALRKIPACNAAQAAIRQRVSASAAAAAPPSAANERASEEPARYEDELAELAQYEAEFEAAAAASRADADLEEELFPANAGGNPQS